jgi:signal transduction histidine kinase
LDFSKIEVGKLDLEIMVASLPAIVDDHTTIMSSIARSRSVALHTFMSSTLPSSIVCDPTRTKQIMNVSNYFLQLTLFFYTRRVDRCMSYDSLCHFLQNLTSNALKFGSRVIVLVDTVKIKAATTPTSQEDLLRLNLDDTSLPQFDLKDDVNVYLRKFIEVSRKSLSESETQQFDRNTATHVRVQVVDNGEGISEEMKLQLFRPFIQGNKSTARLHGGTG